MVQISSLRNIVNFSKNPFRYIYSSLFDQNVRWKILNILILLIPLFHKLLVLIDTTQNRRTLYTFIISSSSKSIFCIIIKFYDYVNCVILVCYLVFMYKTKTTYINTHICEHAFVFQLFFVATIKYPEKGFLREGNSSFGLWSQKDKVHCGLKGMATVGESLVRSGSRLATFLSGSRDHV